MRKEVMVRGAEGAHSGWIDTCIRNQYNDNILGLEYKFFNQIPGECFCYYLSRTGEL